VRRSLLVLASIAGIAQRGGAEAGEVPGLKKKPSTSELLDWLKLLLNEDMSPEMLRERDPLDRLRSLPGKH
jgi:hypothetical protein